MERGDFKKISATHRLWLERKESAATSLREGAAEYRCNSLRARVLRGQAIRITVVTAEPRAGAREFSEAD